MIGSRMKSLQETYAPENRCFGCGPANEKGLHIRSFLEGDEVVATWKAEPHHLAFDGVVNGGIIGALLDCHSNWTAACHLMKKAGAASPPFTVTADFHVRLKRPTPIEEPLHLERTGRRVHGRPGGRGGAELEAGGKVTATCRGTFVAVTRGSPRLPPLVGRLRLQGARSTTTRRGARRDGHADEIEIGRVAPSPSSPFDAWRRHAA